MSEAVNPTEVVNPTESFNSPTTSGLQTECQPRYSDIIFSNLRTWIENQRHKEIENQQRQQEKEELKQITEDLQKKLRDEKNKNTELKKQMYLLIKRNGELEHYAQQQVMYLDTLMKEPVSFKQQSMCHAKELSSAQECSSSQELQVDTADTKSQPIQVKKTKDESLEGDCLAPQAQVNEAKLYIKSQDSILAQRAEELKQIKEESQNTQSLLSSAKRQLHNKNNKNMDLMKNNILLEMENFRLNEELKQFQAKLVLLEHTGHTQAAESEHQQQKIREIKMELAHNSTNVSTITSLQRDLHDMREQLSSADQKAFELQQQLNNAQLLRQEALSRTNTQLNFHIQQQDRHSSILEAELSKVQENEKENQKSIQRLQEELADSKDECNRLHMNLKETLLQLDKQTKDYIKKQNKNEANLQKAKQVFISETEKRNKTIQNLKHDLSLASLKSQKDKTIIQTIIKENEKLLKERQELLRKLCEVEDRARESTVIVSAAKQKVNLLEGDNRRLEDKTVKLSTQVYSLQLALRTTQSSNSLENTKTSLAARGMAV